MRPEKVDSRDKGDITISMRPKDNHGLPMEGESGACVCGGGGGQLHRLFIPTVVP